MEGLPTTRSHSPAHENVPPAHSVYGHGCALFRRFVAFLLVISLILLAVMWLAKRQAGLILHPILLSVLEEHYASNDIAVSLGSVRYEEGRGIWLHDLTFHEQSLQGDTIVSIDEIHITSSSSLLDCLRGGFDAERVHLSGFHANVNYQEDVELRIARLLPLPKMGNRRLPINIVDASARITTRVGQWEITEDLTDLSTVVTPKVILSEAGEPIGWHYNISGEVVGDRVGHLKFAAWYRDNDLRWSAAAITQDLQVTSDLVHASSEFTNQDLGDLARVEGKINLTATLQGMGFEQMPTDYSVIGRVSDARLEDARLPYPIDDLGARFEFTPSRWSIEDLSARIGLGTIRASAERSPNDLQQQEWDLGLSVNNVRLDSRLSSYLPPAVRNVWRDFDPEGLINAEIRLRGTPDDWKPVVNLTLVDVGIRFHMFRYPLRDCAGLVTWTPEHVSVDIAGKASDSRIKVTAEIDNPGRDFTGEVDVKLLEPAPITEELYQAFSKNRGIAKFIRSFNPRGAVGVNAHIHRDDPNDIIHHSITIDAHDGSIEFDQLPYPLTQITGKIIVEDDWVLLKDLVGRNDAGYVTCNGSFSPEKILTLEFLANSVPLEDELRRALPLDLRNVWSQLRPKGNLDHLKINLTHDFNVAQMNLRCEGQMWKHDQVDHNSISINPTWLPYPWHEVTGSFVYDDGTITLKDIRGRHQKTEVSLEASGKANPEGWWLDIQPFAVDRLTTNGELLEALPQPMADSVRAIELEGNINLLGRIVLTYGKPDPELRTPLVKSQPDAIPTPQELEVQWDLDCDVERGSFNIATERIHNAHGSVSLMGAMHGEDVYCWGQLNVDSLMLWEAQGRNLRGPLYLDNQRLALGSMAPQLDPSLPSQSVEGQLLQGKLNLDAELQLTPALPFTVQMILSESRLESFAEELFPQMQDLSGQAYVGLRLNGYADNSQSLDGHGVVRLRHAKIYEFPFMLSLLKILSVRQVDRTAFTTSNIDFRVKADRILLDRIEFIGDAISLRGVGEIDLNHRIQAQFHSTVGRSEVHIPVVSPLFGAASRQILLVSIEGTLEDPKFNRVPFPLINDALQNLIAEPDTTEPQIIPGIPTVSELFDEAVTPPLR